MAGGFVAGGLSERAHLYEHRITAYFIFACIVAALGGSLFGYDLGVSGRSLIHFLVNVKLDQPIFFYLSIFHLINISKFIRLIGSQIFFVKILEVFCTYVTKNVS